MTADQLEEMRGRKDAAYLERNRLVALLAGMVSHESVCLGKTAIEGWDPEWHWCVRFETSEGQLSWHVHESHLYLFDHVRRGEVADTYDGHTTEEKYGRIERLAAKSIRSWIKL